MAAHQGQLLSQRDQADRHAFDVWLLDDQAPRRGEHPQQLNGGLLLILQMVKGIYNEDPGKSAVGEGKSFGLTMNGRQPLETCLLEHGCRLVQHHHVIH